MKTYKTDFSFFGYLNTPGSYFFIHNGLIRWFDSEPNAQFRLIVDLEAEDECLTFSELQDLYPGVKTIAIALNPWRKLVMSYDALVKAKAEGKEELPNFDFSNFTFESFLQQLETPLSRDYSFLTPQSTWFNDANDLLIILRDDYIQEDFLLVQEYFESFLPIEFDLIDYRSYYTEETKKFVEEKFKDDIEKFDFKF